MKPYFNQPFDVVNATIVRYCCGDHPTRKGQLFSHYYHSIPQIFSFAKMVELLIFQRLQEKLSTQQMTQHQFKFRENLPTDF